MYHRLYVLTLICFLMTFADKDNEAHGFLVGFPSDYAAVKKTCEYIGYEVSEDCDLERGSGIIFTAFATSIGSHSTSKKLPFTNVKVNRGSAYSTRKSRFTTPRQGLYVFSWCISSYSSYNAHSKLVKDGVAKHRTKCYGIDQQCCATTILSLSKGNKVWIEPDASSFYMRGAHSSFTGFMLTHYQSNTLLE